MNITELLKQKKFTLKSDGTLFGIDWDAVRKTNRCPLCGNKLYDSQKYRENVICRSKKHKFFKIKKWTPTCFTGTLTTKNK